MIDVPARRVLAVVRNEFRQYRRNRFILGTTIVLPLVFLGIPLANLLALADSAPPESVRALASSAELMMLLVPLVLPTTIAAYAVVGERDQGTLEPMLTTPILEKELILGKALAAIVPSVLIAYLIGAVFAGAVRIQDNHEVVSTVWAPEQILAQVLFVPLLAAWATWVGIAISARSSDVRVAQQLSALASLPMVGLTSLFTFRTLEPSVHLAVTIAVLLLAVDVVAWRVVSAMFDRERLISRYGS
jgi:ABC-2 type transport system permease protein